MYAVFPLSIVVLPNESVALHLFEPRYRQLFRDFKNGKEFAIVYQDHHGLSNYGTLVYIDKIINEFPDETVDVIVKGKSIIKVNQFIDNYPDKLYSAVTAEEVDTHGSSSENLNILFKNYLQSLRKTVNDEDDIDLFYIANRIELCAENKDKMISLESNAEMNKFLINEIKFLQKIREQEGLLNQKFHLN